MKQAKLKEILEKHKKWLCDRDGGEKANLSRAGLSGANLSGADLAWANLSRANLSRANLSGANLSGANLSRANLSGANLSGADLAWADLAWADLSGADPSGANLNNTILSGATGLLNPIDYLAKKFERTKEGYIVYKVFNGSYISPADWNIEPGEIITEEVNSCRTNDCGCGINVAPLEWVQCRYPGKDIYKLLIKWEWLAGVVVPYNTDGKIRCARAQIIGKV